MKNLVITALVFIVCILMFTACSSTRDGGRTIIVSTPIEQDKHNSSVEAKNTDMKKAKASTDSETILFGL